jgi:hypothetical protein
MTSGTGTWNGQQVVRLSSSLGTATLMSPEGKWHAIATPDGKPILSWNPPVGFEFPLHVDQQWTRRHEMTQHAANRTVAYDTTCKVEGYGDVVVPAGTYKAYRVGCTSTIGNDDRFWFLPEYGVFAKSDLKRSAVHPAGTGTQVSEPLTPPTWK